MSRRTGTVVAAIAVWLVIVGATSMVAWMTIDRAGRDAYLTDGSTPGFSESGPGPASGTTSIAPSVTQDASTSATRPATHTSRPQPHRTTTARTTPAPPPSRTASSPRVTPSPARSTPSAATPSPSSTSRPPTASDSVSVTGGSVGVSCQGSTLTLRFATPRNGWSYTISRGATEVEVSFRQNGGEGESEVHAVCSGGVPAFETSSSDGTDDAGAGADSQPGEDS